MALASDQYDPDTGLDHGGDAGLHVRFYERKVIDKANPAINRPQDVEHMEVYCQIIVPGDKNNIWDQPARDQDRARFPRHWLAFQMQTSKQGAGGFGTSLEEWATDEPGVINENQRLELFALRFQRRRARTRRSCRRCARRSTATSARTAAMISDWPGRNVS